jgi:hypothetical protein
MKNLLPFLENMSNRSLQKMMTNEIDNKRSGPSGRHPHYRELEIVLKE